MAPDDLGNVVAVAFARACQEGELEAAEHLLCALEALARGQASRLEAQADPSAQSRLRTAYLQLAERYD